MFLIKITEELVMILNVLSVAVIALWFLHPLQKNGVFKVPQVFCPVWFCWILHGTLCRFQLFCSNTTKTSYKNGST